MDFEHITWSAEQRRLEALKKKPMKGGSDFIRDGDMKPICNTRAGAKIYGDRNMPADLKRVGFETHIFETADYRRVNYGKTWRTA